MRLYIGRFREKDDPLAPWFYICWAEDTRIEFYNEPFVPDEVTEDDHPDIYGYHPAEYVAEVEEYGIPIPGAIAMMIEAMDLLEKRCGMDGVNYAGCALLDDLKLLVLRAYGTAKGETDPLVAAWTPGGTCISPLRRRHTAGSKDWADQLPAATHKVAALYVWDGSVHSTRPQFHPS